MASEAQILANRRNAERSTGPRTEEGKAVVSQNAVKHGLSARLDVISSEDHDEFDRHREEMLRRSAPIGPIETMLAERIVSLSWRLKRVERMQNEALDCLLAEGAAELGSFVQTDDPGAGDPGLSLGRAIVKDFAGDRTLERLMIYERRIENSLYRTMSELLKQKLWRDDDPLKRPESMADSPANAMRAYPVELGTPYGVTTNERLCKTNPILGDERFEKRPESRSGMPGLSLGVSPCPAGPGGYNGGQ